jgi:hypothetical protein
MFGLSAQLQYTDLFIDLLAEATGFAANDLEQDDRRDGQQANRP